MKISTRGRYAVRMLADIAEHEPGYVSLSSVANRQGISKKYLEQIAMNLQRVGMLAGARGYKGGYKLARDAQSITVLDILNSVEGSMAVVECLEDSENRCERCRECKTLPIWTGLKERVEAYLGGITHKDVVATTPTAVTPSPKNTSPPEELLYSTEGSFYAFGTAILYPTPRTVSIKY